MKNPLNLICLLLPLSFVLFFGCNKHTHSATGTKRSSSQIKAQRIVNKAIKVHGGKNYEDLDLEFDFRERHYKVKRKEGIYTYERKFIDKAGSHIHDILTNSGFKRFINDQPTRLDEKQRSGYSNSLNSVVYFVLLPYLLNDAAAVKDYTGEETINNNKYYTIKVTFREEGGGKDFEDEYRYWINKKTHTMDYLAYNFHVNGGGARFRRAYHIRTIKGIRFTDYINYKPIEKTMDVNSLAELYQNNGLKELSKIETENIIVH